jgi:hypothetical protein
MPAVVSNVTPHFRRGTALSLGTAERVDCRILAPY